MVSNNKSIKNIIANGLVIASVISVIMMLLQTGSNDIWYDEVFSVCFAKMSIKDMLQMTSRDVHPPFYYLYLKAVTGLYCVVFGDKNFITIAKLASLVPWLGIAGLTFTYIRKKWNYNTAAIFIFLITLMPQISNYYVEIRMYSLAMLLITICALAACSLADDVVSYKRRKMAYVALFISGILTAYTQYYACIGIVGIYVGLFIVLLIKRKDNYKRDLIILLAMALASVLLYLPWIPVVFKQFNNISGSYWIQPLTLKSIAGCVKFAYLPIADKPVLCYIAAGLGILVSIAVIICYLKKDLKRAMIDGIMLLSPLALVILSGFVLSALGTPIFVYRYMIPVIGLYWLYIAIMLDGISGKWQLFGMCLLPFVLAGVLTFRGFYLEEHKKVEHMPLVEQAFGELPEDAVIVANFDHVAAVSGYYLENNDIYLYEGEIDSILSDIMNGCGRTIVSDEIRDFLEKGKQVYFFGSFVARDDIVRDWEKEGMTATEENSVLLERYWFNIYRLELK